jgi:hypothetical protein
VLPWLRIPAGVRRLLALPLVSMLALTAPAVPAAKQPNTWAPAADQVIVRVTYGSERACG